VADTLLFQIKTEKKITMREIAEAVGEKISTISSLVNGHGSVSLETAKKIAVVIKEENNQELITQMTTPLTKNVCPNCGHSF
jgi:transcriptional regulator with XRE-family HTH domain